MSPHNITAGTEKTLKHNYNGTQPRGYKEMGGQGHAPAALPKENRPDVVCAGG